MAARLGLAFRPHTTVFDSCHLEGRLDGVSVEAYYDRWAICCSARFEPRFHFGLSVVAKTVLEKLADRFRKGHSPSGNVDFDKVFAVKIDAPTLLPALLTRDVCAALFDANERRFQLSVDDQAVSLWRMPNQFVGTVFAPEGEIEADIRETVRLAGLLGASFREVQRSS